MFIVLEGCDGVGKQTQTAALRDVFEAQGLFVKTYSFHQYETELGALIKAHLTNQCTLRVDVATASMGMAQVARANKLMFQCLASADKYSAADAIQQDLANGCVVIADRWWQSSYAYGIADGLDPLWLLQISKSLPQADYNLLLEVPHNIVRVRKPVPDDRYEADANTQLRVAEIYNSLWARMSATSTTNEWYVFDADLEPATVTANITKALLNSETFLRYVSAQLPDNI